VDTRRVAVIGAGPGGLYAATLIRLARPDWDVTVYEHNADGETFGFGVGLTTSTLGSLEAADQVSAASIRQAGHPGDGFDMRVGDGVVIQGGDNIAIGRATLLQILSARAVKVGVTLQTAHVEATALDEDLIVAADGVRSATRDKLASGFGARVRLDDALYLWAGADFALDRATFVPVRTADGVFVVHAYPYGPDRSTFLVETDGQTWRRAGLDVNDAQTPDGESDKASIEHISGVFAEMLGGRRLLGNRTRWQRFASVECDRWWQGNVVLLGDAAHTAHYSIGSGTKLAMEDAIALASALGSEPDVADALSRYESERRPRVERFQQLAGRSHAWWKTFPSRLDMAPATVMSSFMTRAGNISIDAFAAAHPDVAADAVEALNGTRPTDAAVADPDALAEAVLRSRIVHTLNPDTVPVPLDGTDGLGSPDADAAVERARTVRERGARVLWLEHAGPGAVTRLQVLTLCDVAERLRLELGAVVGVDLPERFRSDAVGAMLSGRVDYVRFR
jgi:2-polyprenyl-6-methoxyphenol hydroxylase-like FAD-dependent oxidoreductase